MSKNILLVSLGPGDPDLITIKALKCLQNSDVIFCPGTITKKGQIMSRAFNILVALGISENKIITFNVSMSKDRKLAKADYGKIADSITEHYYRNQSISVCAQGDASFYSSVSYISELLASRKLLVEQIAGVPAFIAAATLVNIQVTKQEERLLVIPGVVTYDRLVEECQRIDNIVIMKLPQSENAIKQAINSVENSSFHYFENIGIEGKEFYSNIRQEILEREFPYFSLLIIKKNKEL